MEIQQDPPTADRFRGLSRNNLFWFLDGVEPDKLEHNIIKRKLNFGSVFAETLGSGATGKMNEDSLAILPMGMGRTLVAAFDGASSQKKIGCLSAEGISGAFYLSKLISLGFEKTYEYKRLCQTEDLTAKGVMVFMNKWIRGNLEKVEGIDYNDTPSVPGMAAAFLLIDVPKGKLTISQVADTMVALVGANGDVKVITPNLNEKFDKETMDYALYLARTYNTDLCHFKKIPEANELFHAHLLESFTRKTNKEGGCGIMNGMPEMNSNGLIYSTQIPMNDGVSSVMLFSDGAILPYTGSNISYEASVKLLAKTAKEPNILSPLKIGASILDCDPNFMNTPRLKHCDDATIALVNLDYKGIESLPLAG
jgi:hypothetical protein